MYFHGVLLGSQHEMWSKQHNGKVSCHVRLKRSGAWWYEESSNQMLALRCAKYNGTFEQVCTRDQHQKTDA